MHRTTIMLPDYLKNRMQVHAAQHHVSLGELLRIAAEQYLEREERKYTDDTLAEGFCIVKEEAPSDVSENINKYLYGPRK